MFSPPDRSDTLVCEDGNDKAVVSKEIPFTDFPLDAIDLVRQPHDLPAERTLTAAGCPYFGAARCLR